MPKELTLSDLKEFLSKYKDIFDRNLHGANADYMEGKIRNGAFQYVLSRHDNLSLILSNKIEKIMNEQKIEILKLFQIAANLTIDMRYMAREEKRFRDWIRWWSFFKERGFTDVHSLFKIPILPKN